MCCVSESEVSPNAIATKVAVTPLWVRLLARGTARLSYPLVLLFSYDFPIFSIQPGACMTNWMND